MDNNIPASISTQSLWFNPSIFTFTLELFFISVTVFSAIARICLEEVPEAISMKSAMLVFPTRSIFTISCALNSLRDEITMFRRFTFLVFCFLILISNTISFHLRSYFCCRDMVQVTMKKNPSWGFYISEVNLRVL